MTKRQFMEELRSSLEGMVSQAVIQENMNYYEDYINEQIRNGKNEQDVLNELGSPRLIARSIIDAKGEDDDYVQTEYYEEEQDEGTPEDMFGGNTHIFTMNSTKFKLGCLLSVIIFIFIIYLLFDGCVRPRDHYRCDRSFDHEDHRKVRKQRKESIWI